MVRIKYFFYLWGSLIFLHTSPILPPHTQNISRRLKPSAQFDVRDLKNLTPVLYGERIVYFDSNNRPQIAYDLAGKIVETYFYNKSRELLYVEVKNNKVNNWIRLEPVNIREVRDPDRFSWEIFQGERCLGEITISIDREYNSMYIGRIDINHNERGQGIGKTVIEFLFNYYKRLSQYSELRSISAHTYNPALAEIFLQLSNNGEITVGEREISRNFHKEQLTGIVKDIIRKTGIWVKFQTQNGEIKAFKINTSGIIEHSDIPQLEGRYVLENLKVERDERNRWNIYINGIHFGIIDRFTEPLRIEVEADY